jgi:hypothetical protein
MKLPNGDHAVVDMRKLRDYCLSTRHPRGRHKARVFSSVLGIDENDAEFLRDAPLDAAMDSEILQGRADLYGQRYILEFEIRGPGGNRKSTQFLDNRSDESFPRLTSCYVM